MLPPPPKLDNYVESDAVEGEDSERLTPKARQFHLTRELIKYI